MEARPFSNMAAPSGSDLSRLVGWINRLEWQTVFDRLYSDDVKLQQQAVDRISAWKSRFGDQIPVSIECSTSLVRAQIMDKCGDSADAVQLAYSIAIIRFVNLITGREQIGLIRGSVSWLAKKVGLPSWMVDLRHEAVHKFMPSTAVLREGATYALDWLKVEYWEAQSNKGHLEKEPEGWSTDTDTKESVAAGLILYQQEQFQVMDDNEKPNSTSNCDSSLTDLEELLTSNHNARHMIASALLMDGYLVPTHEQLESLRISKGYSEDNNKTPVLDPKIISFWTPLLRLLQSFNITPLLLASLLKELMKFTQPGNQTATLLQGWAILIAMEAGRGPITAPSPGSKRSRSPHRNGETTKTLYEGCKTIHLPWNDLVDICIENPNCYTLSVLPKMLWHMTPKPNHGTVKKITQLCSLLTHQPQKETDSVPQKGPGKGKKYNKKSKGNSSSDQSKTSTDTSVDDGRTVLDTGSIPAMVNPQEDEASHGSPGVADREAGHLKMSQAHSVEELVALVMRKQKDSQRLVGVSAQSAKDAKVLRRQKTNDWTKCKEHWINWGAYPLGVLPGQPDDPDYFMLNIHEGTSKRSSDMGDAPVMDQNGKSTTSWKYPKFHDHETEQLYTHQRKSADQTSEVQNREKHAESSDVSSSLERGIPSWKTPDLVIGMESSSLDLVVDKENFQENEAEDDGRTEPMTLDQDSCSPDVIALF
ncbi:ribosomal biogenesis protein LAS1L-like [Amphiura filiformis]|uniref:ribosomal biogenesis protein LAS1L-like n=1 Tax=Amphiura filiformis TaxID=82378 RepID=UPI003B212FC4